MTDQSSRECDRDPNLRHRIELIESGLKWSWSKFFIGFIRMFTSPAFIAFSVFSFITWHIGCGTLGNYNGHAYWFLVGYIIVTVIFIIRHCVEEVLLNISKRADFQFKANFGPPSIGEKHAN